MLFFLDNLLIPQESVSLQCVFHSIRFKVNKGWSKALLAETSMNKEIAGESVGKKQVKPSIVAFTF